MSKCKCGCGQDIILTEEHIRRKRVPKYIKGHQMRGLPSWNKGLTIDDKRVKNNIDKKIKTMKLQGMIKSPPFECNHCGVELNDSNWYPSFQKSHNYSCIECHLKRSGEYNKSERGREIAKTFYKNHTYQESLRHRRTNQKYRYIAIEHYSKGTMKCMCCGENIYEFLTIDHINGGGRKHRTEIKGTIYKWLVDNNFPDGFQVLCYNCNSGKRVNNGVCPHKTLNPATVNTFLYSPTS